MVHYWEQKKTDPSFHSQTHGGRRFVSFKINHRHANFTVEQEKTVEALLLQLLQMEPSSSYGTIVSFFHTKLNISRINKSFIQRIFKKWRWRAKVPAYVQIHKYTEKNIRHYLR